MNTEKTVCYNRKYKSGNLQVRLLIITPFPLKLLLQIGFNAHEIDEMNLNVKVKINATMLRIRICCSE